MHWTDRLSEYLDGELSPGEDAACDAHLEACEGCREVLRDLQLVVLTARADRDREPRDGWAGVRAQLAGARTGHAPPRREIAFSLPQLALAASLLIAVTAAVSHLATGRVAEPAPAAEPAIQAMAEPLMPPVARRDAGQLRRRAVRRRRWPTSSASCGNSARRSIRAR